MYLVTFNIDRIYISTYKVETKTKNCTKSEVNMSRTLGHLHSTKVHFYKLYRAILRSHKMLPGDMRDLGDKFVKIEFREHKNMDNIEDELIRKFFVEWTVYLNEMIQQSKLEIAKESNNNNNNNNSNQSSSFGKNLDINQIQGMSQTQLDKLESFWKISDDFNQNISR